MQVRSTRAIGGPVRTHALHHARDDGIHAPQMRPCPAGDGNVRRMRHALVVREDARTAIALERDDIVLVDTVADFHPR